MLFSPSIYHHETGYKHPYYQYLFDIITQALFDCNLHYPHTNFQIFRRMYRLRLPQILLTFPPISYILSHIYVKKGRTLCTAYIL